MKEEKPTGKQNEERTFQKLLKCHVATSQIAKILTLSFNCTMQQCSSILTATTEATVKGK